MEDMEKLLRSVRKKSVFILKAIFMYKNLMLPEEKKLLVEAQNILPVLANQKW